MAYEAGQSVNANGSYVAGQSEAFTANKLLFASDYDGEGTNRLLYFTNGSGAATLYTGTIDHIVLTQGDPRYLDAASAPPVLARFTGESITDGAAELTQADTAAGNLNAVAAGTLVYCRCWNSNGSFDAIFTIKLLGVE